MVTASEAAADACARSCGAPSLARAFEWEAGATVLPPVPSDHRLSLDNPDPVNQGRCLPMVTRYFTVEAQGRAKLHHLEAMV